MFACGGWSLFLLRLFAFISNKDLHAFYEREYHLLHFSSILWIVVYPIFEWEWQSCNDLLSQVQCELFIGSCQDLNFRPLDLSSEQTLLHSLFISSYFSSILFFALKFFCTICLTIKTWGFVYFVQKYFRGLTFNMFKFSFLVVF